jgi:hypothetical protein
MGDIGNWGEDERDERSMASHAWEYRFFIK